LLSSRDPGHAEGIEDLLDASSEPEREPSAGDFGAPANT